MNESARRVAVLGGIRIPFARQNGPYAKASNQDMLTADAGRAGVEVRAGGRDRRARSRPARCSSTAATSTSPASGAGLHAGARDARLRRAAGLRHRPGGDDPGRQQDRAGPDRLRHRRRRRHDLGRAAGAQRGPAPDCCSTLNRAKSNADRLQDAGPAAPQQIVPEIPRNAEPRTGLSMGEHAALMATEWGICREEQDELAVASHHNAGRRLRHRLAGRPGHALPGARARPEPAPGHQRREAGQAQARVRRTRGDDDRRQLDPAQRRRLGRAAGQRGVGGGARDPGAGLLHRGPDRGRRLRAQARGPADGARLRDAADAGPSRRSGCRTSTSTRSTRRSPRRCCARSRPGRTRCSAASAWGSSEPLGAIDRDRLNVHGGSLAPGIRSAPPAAGSSPTLAKELSEQGSGRGVISICAAGRTRGVDRRSWRQPDDRPLPAAGQHPDRAR